MSSIPICSICCDKFTSNSDVQTTKCGHIFHADCIRRWLNTKNTCPQCRQTSTLLHRIYLNFPDAEANNIQEITPTAGDTEKNIENLVLKLSLEESRRLAAEKSLRDNLKKQREFDEILRKKDKEQQRLRILLEEGKLRHRALEELSSVKIEDHKRELPKKNNPERTQRPMDLGNESSHTKIDVRRSNCQYHSRHHHYHHHQNHHNHHNNVQCARSSASVVASNTCLSGLKNIIFPDKIFD